jgi:hypothetical protein
LKPDLDVPASATPDEAAAIVTAIEMVLAQRRVVNNAPETPQRSAWAEAARREAIVDRV